MNRGGCLAILAAAIVLAGCTGGSPGGPQATAAPDPTASGADSGLVVLRSGLAAPVAKTVWANGTVAFQDTCNTGGCILDTRAFRVTEVGGDIPRGGAVRMEVELAWQPHPVGIGGFDAWVQAEGDFYAYDVDWEPGHALVQAVLAPEGDVQVVMAAYGPGGETPETPYTLRIRIEADPQIVEDGVPVSLALRPGSTVTAEGIDGQPAAFVLYRPDGTRLDRFEGRVQLPGSAREGEYALLIPNGQAPARIATDSGDERLATLGLSLAVGEEGTVPQYGAYDQSWDVTGDPVGVGVMAYNIPSAAGPAPLVSAGFAITMEGPGGFTLDTGTQCSVCLTFGDYLLMWGSGIGDERVSAGTYNMHVQSDGTYEVRAAPYAVYIERA